MDCHHATRAALKKVSFIFGTRPEAIKLCPVILGMRSHEGFSPHVCVTAQHRELLDQVLSVFGVVPDIDLNLMKPNQTLTSLTAKALQGLNDYLAEHKPDLVVVQGDTTSTFCAALAAFYNQIPLAHVEAGLRTGNKLSPYPEEVNRALTTRLADYHFAPTTGAKDNLLREGISEEQIFVTGNTVVDAIGIALASVRARQIPITGLPSELMNGHRSTPLVLVTSHRRESFGSGFQSICEAIRQLAHEFPLAIFVYPVHLNPNVRKPVFELLSNIKNVLLLEPLPYPEFVALMDRAKFILTDSGGIQEEAPSASKPVLVMREATERPEAVDSGTTTLVGTDVQKIMTEARRLFAGSFETLTTNPFGDGKASQRILEVISRKLFTESEKV
jgi:UDP-N-acetylglucosamine 2-epimerase (non-hydrolysing)